jgi:hypothetical protein
MSQKKEVPLDETTPLQSWSTASFGSSQPTTPSSTSKRKSRIAEFVEHKDWQNANCYDELLEILFRIKERNSTVSLEVYAGVIQFISCESIVLSLSHSTLLISRP